MPFFESIEMHPEDPILGLGLEFAKDPRPNKVNLGVGAYKNAEGSPQVLSSVRDAEKILIEKQLNKEYLPIQGNHDYIQESLKLVFGKTSTALVEGRIAAAQTIGGTSALRIGGDLIKKNNLSDTIFVSDPTWTNHLAIFGHAGLNIDSYSYFDSSHHCLSFSAMMASLKNIPPGTAVLFQPCCHNPTGLDPSFEEWKEVCQLTKGQKLIPFFDFAYQGFGKGVAEDAEVIRYFEGSGQEMLISISHSKNFGLYGERVGLLAIVCKDQDAKKRVLSEIKQLIRGCYSMPPLQGQRIVTEILQNEHLRKEWTHELENMRGRIQEMRKTLLSALKKNGAGDRFAFLEKQSGMFSFSGLNENQVHTLKKTFGIYLPVNGRINVAGLNPNNIDYVVSSMLSVIEPEI